MRLRLLRGNAAEVILRYTCDLDKPAADCRWTNVSMQYERADVNGYYDYYIGEIPPQKSAYRYHFIVKNNVESIVYNAENTYKGDSVPDSLSSDFLAQINFSTPDWSKGMLWYSAMPDSFYNGETFSDKYGGSINQNIWGLTHSGGLDYFGGDLNGLLQKTDYFKELNVNGLYINPIWLANHNAGYGAMDLANLDSTFGSEPMLTLLTEKLHENNMRFMLDGVFAFLTQASVYVNGENLWNTKPATRTVITLLFGIHAGRERKHPIQSIRPHRRFRQSCGAKAHLFFSRFGHAILFAARYRRLEARFFGTVRRHEYQRHEDHSRYAEVYERGRARFATVY